MPEWSLSFLRRRVPPKDSQSFYWTQRITVPKGELRDTIQQEFEDSGADVHRASVFRDGHYIHAVFNNKGDDEQ